MKTLHFVAALVAVLHLRDEAMATPAYKGIPSDLARLLYMFNGEFKAKVKVIDSDGKPGMSDSTIVNRPVLAKGFSDPTYIYIEDDPDVTEYALYSLSQDSNGYIHSHEFTVPTSDVDRSEITNDGLLILPPDAKIKMLKRCSAVTEVEDNGEFTVSWEDCVRPEDDGSHPVVIFRHIRCNEFTVVVTLASETLVHKYKRVSDRFLFPPEIEEQMSVTGNPC